MTYKRINHEFNAKLQKRAEEIRRARIIRPYSLTIAEQLSVAAEDREYARIQAQLPKTLTPAPKIRVWEAIIFFGILSVIALILALIAISIGGWWAIPVWSVFAIFAATILTGGK